MRLSARMENKNTGFQIRAHGSLAERFSRYVYLNNACSNGNDSDNNRNNKNHIKNNCWQWMGARNDRGYGVIGQGTRKQGISKAHRIAYELFYFTKLEKDNCICHICDNPACVNPNHLSIGTPKDNSQDMIAKGRKKVVAPLGEGNGKAKLTVEKVKLIKQSNLKSAELARQFGLSENCIRGVRIGRTWSHVVI
jgi:hypothetical protein